MKSLSLAQPHAIILVGLPGSGKTFFATKFAETFNAPRLSHDVLAEHISDPSAADTLGTHLLEEFLKSKQSLVVDGFAHTRAQRSALVKQLKKAGYRPLFVWVQTDAETTKSRSLKAGKHSEETHEHLTKRFSPPHPTEGVVVISGKHTYATQAKVILKHLSAPRAAISTHTTPIARSLSGIRRSR